jgi:hypothetical protein
MKAFRAYSRPKEGKRVITDRGAAAVSKISSYHDVVEEMKRNGLAKKEIEQFNFRVEHFLGKRGRYFECELFYPDSETTRIDWSEYLFIRRKIKSSNRTRRKAQRQRYKS